MGEVLGFPSRRAPDGVIPHKHMIRAESPGIYLDVLRGFDRIGCISFGARNVVAFDQHWSVLGEFPDVESAVTFIKGGRRTAHS